MRRKDYVRIAYMNRSSAEPIRLDAVASDMFYRVPSVSDLPIHINDSQLSQLKHKKILREVDQELQVGAERMALALGVDLSK